MPVLPEDLFEFASQPNPSVMATLTADGNPACVPVWYLIEDPGHLLLSIATDQSRADRLNHLRADPRMSISILGHEDWHQSVSIRGTAIEFFNDKDLVIIDAMAVHYSGSFYAKRSPRMAVRVRIDDWTSEVSQPVTDNVPIRREDNHVE